MNQFYCLAMHSVKVSRYFETLQAAQEAAKEESVKLGDCIYLMQLIAGEYEIVEEYGIECLG